MKVYWSDREGNSPPEDAIFSWRYFLPRLETPKMSGVSRVRELPAPTRPIRVASRRFLPEKNEWISAIEKAVGAIGRKELEKVVLARCCILECEEAPDPFAVISALKAKGQNTTLFCFAGEEMAFLGSTPEILFRRQKDQLQSEALAGTIKRGQSASEDDRLGRELLESAKDLREFTPVETFLKEALSPLCKETLSFSPLHVRKAGNVQHLCSRLSATLRGGISDADILSRIHPTPALCGAPQEAAFDWIRQIEPFSRGLYGGAVGWSTRDASEWAVAIRCCMIRGKTVHLYTGTGIVEGSDPAEEWEELDLKMKLYDGIFV